MKTTIELPEELFMQAKRAALEQGTTLKALIESGLRYVLAQESTTSPMRFKVPVISSMAATMPAADSVNQVIDALRVSKPIPDSRA